MSVKTGRVDFEKTAALDDELLELTNLIAGIRDASDWAEHSLCDGRRIPSGIERICSRISGARRSMPMT